MPFSFTKSKIHFSCRSLDKQVNIYHRKYLPILLLIFFSCEKEAIKPYVDVYVAGMAINGGSAVYWKNSDMVLLNKAGEATDLVVSGGDVYVSGTSTASFIKSAVYWKNGEEVTLATGTNSYASSIAVAGSDIYVAGRIDENAVYWKNGVATALTDGTRHTYVKDVAVNGSDVYVVGTSFSLGVSAPASAICWKNGLPIVLSVNNPLADARAVSVFIKDQDVYISGQIENSSVYWKNNNLVNLESADLSEPYSIVVEGNDVYVLGQSTDGKEIVWKNGQVHSRRKRYIGLNLSLLSSSMAVHDSDIYVTGVGFEYDSQSNFKMNRALYSKNQANILLDTGTGGGYASSIFLVSR